MELIYFILAVYGISNILVNEYIFSKPRKFIEKWFPYSLLNKLFHCTICMSFWIGVFLYQMISINTGYFALDLIITGSLASGVTKILEFILIRYN